MICIVVECVASCVMCVCVICIGVECVASCVMGVYDMY